MTRAGWPDLPPLLAEFADAIGIEGALAIAEAKGGQLVSITSKMSDEHWLVRLIGREKAEHLAETVLAGKRMQFDIPRGPTGSYKAEQRRRAQIVAEALAGSATASEAARRAGITRRSVQRQKAGGRRGGKASGQGSLF